MKILKSGLCIFSFILIFLMSSCVGFNSDAQIAKNKLLELFNNIENKNKEELKNMFAEDVKNISDTNIELEIDSLLDFYQGTHETLICNQLEASRSRDPKENILQLYMDYTIVTTKSTNYLNLSWYIENSTDKDSIGIWFLCIEEYKDGISRSFDEKKIKSTITILDNFN